jgi:hypothetical protein
MTAVSSWVPYIHKGTQIHRPWGFLLLMLLFSWEAELPREMGKEKSPFKNLWIPRHFTHVASCLQAVLYLKQVPIHLPVPRLFFFKKISYLLFGVMQLWWQEWLSFLHSDCPKKMADLKKKKKKTFRTWGACVEPAERRYWVFIEERVNARMKQKQSVLRCMMCTEPGLGE